MRNVLQLTAWKPHRLGHGFSRFVDGNTSLIGASVNKFYPCDPPDRSEFECYLKYLQAYNKWETEHFSDKNYVFIVGNSAAMQLKILEQSRVGFADSIEEAKQAADELLVHHGAILNA